jgi:hypothetical protein
MTATALYKGRPIAVGKRLAVIVSALVLALTALFTTTAQQAHATATGCSYFGTGSIGGYFIANGNYCSTLAGSGSFVYDVDGHFTSYGTVCNWDITAEFFTSNWTWKQTRVSSHHWGCDHYAGDWISIYDRMSNLVGSNYGYECSTLRVAYQRLTSVCHYVHP